MGDEFKDELEDEVDPEEEREWQEYLESIKKPEITARILVHGDLTPTLETLKANGIEVVDVDENTHILVVPKSVVRKGAMRKEHLSRQSLYKAAAEYAESDDESLSDVITQGQKIVVSGKLEEVEGKSYGFEAKGKIRAYNDRLITGTNLVLSSQNDISGLWEFAEYMLRSGVASILPEEKKQEQQPTP